MIKLVEGSDVQVDNVCVGGNLEQRNDKTSTTQEIWDRGFDTEEQVLYSDQMCTVFCDDTVRTCLGCSTDLQLVCSQTPSSLVHLRWDTVS